MAEANDFLMHYGIPGMKWGRRRTEAQLKRARAKNKTKDLSDDELASKVKRLNMEKQYRDLKASERASQQVFDGKKFASNVLQNSATSVATTVLTKAGVYAVKKGVEKAFGVRVKQEMFPKKGG